MSETIATYPQQITNINNERQCVVITLLAYRTDDEGNRVALTKSQVESARNAAAAALEILDGTEVESTSTPILLPDATLAEGETMTLTVDASIVKNTTEQ